MYVSDCEMRKVKLNFWSTFHVSGRPQIPSRNILSRKANSSLFNWLSRLYLSALWIHVCVLKCFTAAPIAIEDICLFLFLFWINPFLIWKYFQRKKKELFSFILIPLVSVNCIYTDTHSLKSYAMLLYILPSYVF